MSRGSRGAEAPPLHHIKLCAPEGIRTPNLLIRSSDADAAMASILGDRARYELWNLHRGRRRAAVRGSVRGSRSPAVGLRMYLPKDDDALQHVDRSWRRTPRRSRTSTGRRSGSTRSRRCAKRRAARGRRDERSRCACSCRMPTSPSPTSRRSGICGCFCGATGSMHGWTRPRPSDGRTGRCGWAGRSGRPTTS